MAVYTLTFDVSAAFSAGMPKLQIKFGGAKLDTSYLGAGSSTLSYQIDTDGPFDHSLLRFYFVKNYGSDGDTINISNVRVNGSAIDMSAFTHNKGSSGNSSSVTLTKGSYSDYNAADEIPEVHDIESGPAATITGDNSDNKIYGTDTVDVINGLDGNDKIIAKGGNDTVSGGNGNDVISGQDGDDTLNGNAGNDTIYGNAGNDIINGGDNDDRLYGNEDNDTIDGGLGNDTIYGGTGIDNLTGGDGDDIISGEDGNDQLFGDAGSDQLFGGDGNDTIRGGADNDRVLGNNGNDTLYGDGGADNIDGQLGDDTIYGGTGNDTIDGEQGDDILYGEDGNDTIMGGQGADAISGGAGDDIIHGGGVSSYDQYVVRTGSAWGTAGVWYSEATNSFYRYISGTTDFASAEATANSSLLNGVAGHIVNVNSQVESDFLQSFISGNTWIGLNDRDTEGEWIYSYGNEANMAIYNGNLGGSAAGPAFINFAANEPNDYGAGEDTIEMRTDGLWNDNTGNRGYIIEWSGESVLADNSANSLNGGDGNDLIYGGSGIDTIHGNNDDDTVFGLNGNDIIFGDNGNDFLSGGNGNDAISGGNNNDILYGNVGSDTLNGGAGNDILYALDVTSNRNATGPVLSGGPVTVASETFTSGNTGIFGYTLEQDGGGVNVNGSTNGDGDAAGGSLEVYIDRTGSYGASYGFWQSSTTLTENLEDVQVTFSYRHYHYNQNDNGEDSYVMYGLNGSYNTISTALGSGGTTNTGWVTYTVDLGDLTAGTTINFDLGIYHTGANGNNEDAYARFDDFSITGTAAGTLTAGNTTVDADSGSANVLNGDAGADVLYGSSGNDVLNGGADADVLYSGSIDNFTAQLNAILAANPNVSYNYETGNFYQIVATAGTNWGPANGAAQAALLNGVNGHLATVTSQTEHDFLKSLANGTSTWLGGTDTGTEGVWRWVTGPENGQQFANSSGNSVNGNYSAFTGGQPNDSDGTQDYLYMLDGDDFADLVAIGNGSTGYVTVDQYAIEWEGSLVFASLNKNVLNGGTGNDQLYGSDGMDVFYFDNTTSQDTIYNFNAIGRDSIDISDIISYNRTAAHNIDDFVRLTESGGNTILAVDANGASGGSNFVNIATINGVTGLNLDEAITANNIIVA